MAIGLSVVLHVGAFFLVYRAPPPEPARHPPIDIEVVVTRPAAPAAPSASPAQPAPAAKAPRPVRRAAKAVKAAPNPAPQRQEAPPAPTAPAKAAPMRIGLSLSSTTPSGGPSMPVGGGLEGAPSAQATGDTGAANDDAGASSGVVQSYALTKAPSPDGEPDLRAYYPPDAAREALEGQVVLHLTIDATGKVIGATVVKGAGHGFDEAALRAATQKLHFKPAQKDGRAVATQIDYTLTFLLD